MITWERRKRYIYCFIFKENRLFWVIKVKAKKTFCVEKYGYKKLLLDGRKKKMRTREDLGGV